MVAAKAQHVIKAALAADALIIKCHGRALALISSGIGWLKAPEIIGVHCAARLVGVISLSARRRRATSRFGGAGMTGSIASHRRRGCVVA